MTYIIENISEDGITKLYKVETVAENNHDIYVWYHGEWDYHDNVGKQGLEYILNNATTIYEEKKK